MSHDDSTIDPSEAILARLAFELESTADAGDVVQRYCDEYPHLAQRIREWCQTWLALQQVGVASSNLEGTRLGSFTLERWLGQGMGVVYAAKEDPPLSRRVAVKIMRPERLSSRKDEQRFELEQALLARLNQPHIVPILQTGHASGLQYFVMPLIEGASLAHVVRAAYEVTTASQDSTCPSVAELARSAADSKALSSLDHVEQDGAAAHAAHSSIGPRQPLQLSDVYFRSLAKVLCDVANAVHHVHQIGVLHRDIKPSNILVTTQGEGRLIDLGLAAFWADQSEAPEQHSENRAEPAAVGTKTTAICGTPPYMAPEQFSRRADVRTDVWGLGVTLYELLTLRRAFAGRDVETQQWQTRIESHEPASPHSIVRNVPRDLEVICLKALRKNPAERHQSAEEFANDLKRWLNGEACHAWPPGWDHRLRGPGSPRALWLRCRRRPRECAAVAAASIAILGGIFAAIWFLQYRAVEAQRELQRLELHQIRTGPHADGWSETAWSLARELAGKRRDPLLRDEAAATLFGWDARRVKQFPDPATSLAFNADGTQLVMGGWTDGDKTLPARVWDSRTDRTITPRPVPVRDRERASETTSTSQPPGSGPVTFNSSGTPLQLVADPTNRWRLVLWDVKRQEPRQTFMLVSDATEQPPTADTLPVMAISSDGALVAASAELANGSGVTAVWETATGRELYRDSLHATAISFSPDGALFALAVAGQVVVRNTTDSKELARLPIGRAAINAIAFGRDPRPMHHRSAIGNWRLAVGGSGGLITIWNLRDGSVLAQCRGSHYDVSSIDFSPDGALAVSTGRYRARLWDVATGRLLLTFGKGNTFPAVRFSPSGTQVALCAVPAFGWWYGAELWQLENGRGLKTLHGLAGPVDKVCYSPDERFIAALSQDWQVGIWELPSGNLRHVIDVPQGAFADNAALAFNKDGSQFAFSTGNRAVLWDVITGNLIKEWPLPPGLGDMLAFHSSGKLLSVRFETAGKELTPYAVDWKVQPCVVRLRNLFGERPEEPILEIKKFSHSVPQSLMSRDGSYFVIEGVARPEGNERSIRAYDGSTGQELWAIESLPFDHSGWLQADPSGRLLALRPSRSKAALVKMPSGQLHSVISNDPRQTTTALGPEASLRVRRIDSPRFGYHLHRGDSPEPLVILGQDIASFAVMVQFNSRGTHLAWGNVDGTVFVCDLRQVQKRLSGLGFGW